MCSLHKLYLASFANCYLCLVSAWIGRGKDGLKDCENVTISGRSEDAGGLQDNIGIGRGFSRADDGTAVPRVCLQLLV